MILSLKDLRHLGAAREWLEKGDYAAAFGELYNIETQNSAHPEVAKLRWEIYTADQQHGSAFVVAEGLTRLLPRDAESFIWRSRSARLMEGGTLEHALELLLMVAHEFPDAPGIPYDLACYSCQLGRMPEARSWLQIAFDTAGSESKAWQLRAVDERDLQPLWAEIRKD